MDYSNPVVILFASILVTVMGLKVKNDCYYCFIGLFFIGLILFIFGIIKFWKRRNG